MPYVRKSRKPVMRKRRRTTRRVSAATKKYVKSAIHRNIENKHFTDYGANQSINVALVGAVQPTVLNFFPSLSEGAENGERLGNKVRMVGNFLNMYINILPYNAGTNTKYPLNVRCWIVKYKELNANATFALSDWNSFFTLGNSNLGFQGNMLDMILPVNKNKWIVYEERSFKLGLGQGSSSYGSSHAGYDNSSFNKHLKFQGAKHWKNSLNYTVSGTSLPTNTNLWFVVQVVPSDGSTEVGPLAEMHYTQHMTYEDA